MITMRTTAVDYNYDEEDENIFSKDELLYTLQIRYS